MTPFGERVRRLRRERGLLLKDMAAHLGVSSAYLSALERATPKYEWMPGWQTSTGTARRIEDLPPAARRYLDRLQEVSETPITYVSVGTRRDQIIGM